MCIRFCFVENAFGGQDVASNLAVLFSLAAYILIDSHSFAHESYSCTKELYLPSRMAMYDKSDMKGGMMDDSAPIHRIRITLTSSNVKSLEKGRCSETSCLKWFQMLIYTFIDLYLYI